MPLKSSTCCTKSSSSSSVKSNRSTWKRFRSEVEPFGTRTIAVKTTAAGINAAEVEHMLHEILEQFEREEQSLNLEKIRTHIAATIACHAAIKVNMPLEQNKMEWLLQELAKTDCPMSCPHGRPVVLRYSVKDIQRAFKRI